MAVLAALALRRPRRSVRRRHAARPDRRLRAGRAGQGRRLHGGDHRRCRRGDRRRRAVRRDSVRARPLDDRARPPHPAGSAAASRPRRRAPRPRARAAAPALLKSGSVKSAGVRRPPPRGVPPMLQPDREVDARGLNCPLPILRTKKALNDMVTRPDDQGARDRPGVGPRFPGFRPPDRQRARRAGRGRRCVPLRAEAQMSPASSEAPAGTAGTVVELGHGWLRLRRSADIRSRSSTSGRRGAGPAGRSRRPSPPPPPSTPTSCSRR